jgi:hypothetical protein
MGRVGEGVRGNRVGGFPRSRGRTASSSEFLRCVAALCVCFGLLLARLESDVMLGL